MKTIWLLVFTYCLKVVNGRHYRGLKKSTKGMGSVKKVKDKSTSAKKTKSKGKHDQLANLFAPTPIAYDSSQDHPQVAPSSEPSSVFSAEPSQLHSSSPSSTPTISLSSAPYQAGDSSARITDFYVAFAQPDGYGDLTDAQVKALVKSTGDFILENASSRYPAVKSVSLTVARQSLDEGVPDERFNFLLEFESATFVTIGPLPSDKELFQILEESVNVEYIIGYVRVLPGFTGVNEVWLSALDK